MKRILLGLIMVGSFALMAAPMANATAPFCTGRNYAFLVQGTEPVTATSAGQTLPLNYIVGVGVINFAKTTCAASGEMIYIDNDIGVETAPASAILAGPAACYTGTALPGSGGVPCFSGLDSNITGGVGPGPNGSYTIEIGVTFPFVAYSGGTPATLPFAFTVFSNVGAATLIGNSNIPPGTALATLPGFDTPANSSVICDAGFDPWGCGPSAPTPPIGPVLSFTAQVQSATAALVPVPTTFGAAPYIGNAAILCNGFSGNSSDLVASAQATQPDEATGGYGATSGSLTTFAPVAPATTGLAYGSLSFNSNDDVGNTTGISNYDCDFQQEQNNAYGDGTSNNEAILYDENFAGGFASPTCRDADAGLTPPATYPVTGSAIGAYEVNSSVVWGTSDQNQYTIVTGLAENQVLLGIPAGTYLPPGEMATCTSLQEAAAPGKVTVLPSTATAMVAATNGLTVKRNITLTNTSEGACGVGIGMAPSTSGPQLYTNGLTGIHFKSWNTTCNLSLEGATSPTYTDDVLIEGGTPSTTEAVLDCTCTCVDAGGYTGACVAAYPLATGTPPVYAATATSYLGAGSANCLLAGGGPTVITCHN